MGEGEYTGLYYEGPPMYWLIPVGFAVGCIVVVFFEWFNAGLTKRQRVSLFQLLDSSDGGEIDEKVREKLELNPDGLATVTRFWSGGAVNTNISKDQLAKVYECLALTSALLFTVSITLYVESSVGDHLFGIVSCLSNCTWWMATMSSAFFSIVVHSLKEEEEVQALANIYGMSLMRIPMLLFVWGLMLLFLVFTIFFKLNVDPGFPCSMCLAACFVIAPLFFHCMHKMYWAVAVVSEATEATSHVMISVGDIECVLVQYFKSKGNYCLNMDKTEFLQSLPAVLKKMKLTSVEMELASQLFDEFTLRELKCLKAPLKNVQSLKRCGCMYSGKEGDDAVIDQRSVQMKSIAIGTAIPADGVHVEGQTN